MSHVHKPPLAKEQTAELLLKYLDAGEMPDDELLNSKELTAFLFNMAINDPLLAEKSKGVSYALYRIKIRFCYDVKQLKSIGLQQRHPGKSNSPYMIDAIKTYPQLLIEIPSIPNDLREHCNKILGTKTPQWRPYTLGEFMDNVGEVGDVVTYRFHDKNNTSQCEWTSLIIEIEDCQDGESKTCQSKIYIGGCEFLLKELFEHYEYRINGQWQPFGVEE